MGMTIFYDNILVRWNHVMMLVHECRNNDVIAKAAVDGIENEFILSIRRRAVAEDGKIRFERPVKTEAPVVPVEEVAIMGKDRDIETVISDLTFGPAILLDSILKTATGSLKKAWRVLWP